MLFLSPRLQFGVYEWKADGSQARVRRKSAALLERWFRELPGQVAQLRQQEKSQRQQGQEAEEDSRRSGALLMGRLGAGAAI